MTNLPIKGELDRVATPGGPALVGLGGPQLDPQCGWSMRRAIIEALQLKCATSKLQLGYCPLEFKGLKQGDGHG